MPRRFGFVSLLCGVSMLACTGQATEPRTPAHESGGYAKMIAPRDASEPRVAAIALAVTSLVAAGAAIGFALAGSAQDAAIRDGDLATGREISDAASRGQTFDNIAVASGAVSLAALGAAIGLYLYAQPSSAPRPPHRSGTVQ